VNITDPDSRVMRTQGQPTVQGYNAQAAVTAEQIIVAAEITTASPDFGHLEPVFEASVARLELAGVSERPRLWSLTRLLAQTPDGEDRHGGTQVLVPPTQTSKRNPAPAGPAAL